MLLNLCIIGTGMYVSGRGTDGFGTILPAVSCFHKQIQQLREVHVVGTSVARTQEAEVKAQQLAKLTGVALPLQFHPTQEDSIQSYRQVLEKLQLPGCAIVVVPDHLHCEIAAACIKKGLHTLVVKPLTPTLDEARALIDLANGCDVYGAVEFHKRWDRQNRMLREAFQAGKLGIPLYTWTEYSQRKSIPSEVFQSWAERTNILQYLGVHYIDLIRFVTGAVPWRVMATGQKVWLVERGIDTYDAIQCLVEWQTAKGHNFTQTLLVNWIDPETSSAMSDQKLKFVGTSGRYECDQKERGVKILLDDCPLEEPNPDFCRPYCTENGYLAWEGYGIDSINSFLGDVVSLIEGKKSPQEFEGIRPTFSESLFSTAVIEAAERSLENHSSWQLSRL